MENYEIFAFRGTYTIKKYLLHRVVVEKHPKPSEKIKKIWKNYYEIFKGNVIYKINRIN